MGDTRFKHSPLREKETYIRLLTILADGDAEEISCDVQSFYLATCPSFEAVSYTWGNPFPADQVRMFTGELFPSAEEFQARSVDWTSETHSIHCNGSVSYVSLNLFQLLGRLKSFGVTGFIWIDRICIDQMNWEEKSAQVRIMPNIYKRANSVIVWLGRSSADSAAAAEIQHKFAGPISRLVAAGQLEEAALEADDPGDGSGGEGSLLAGYGIEVTAPETWFAWTQFFRRSWFFRRWTLQEIALARDVQILCGDQVLDWRRLRFLVRYFHVSRWSPFFQQFMLNQENQPVKALLASGFVESSSLDLAAWRRELVESHGVFSIGSILTELLYATSMLQCSDPLDIFYSIKGIIDMMSSTYDRFPLRIDYSIEPAALYTRMTRVCLETCPDLAILSLMKDSSQRSTLDLPSWVPDFQFISREMMSVRLGLSRRRPGGIPYNVANDIRDLTPLRVVRGPELHLNGFRAGDLIACHATVATRDPREYLQSMLDFYSALPVFNHRGEHRVEVVWRSLVGDVEGISHPAPTELEADFREFILKELFRWKVKADSQHDELMAACDQLTTFGSGSHSGNLFHDLAAGGIWRDRLDLTPAGSSSKQLIRIWISHLS